VPNYLEPEDDGLPMRPAGHWAAEKLDYLGRYIDAFETSMRSKWAVRNYIDLLAGPGKNRIRETGEILLGSPLRALTARYPFTRYFFVDLSEENIGALRQRCSDSSYSERVDIQTGDCNILIDQIVMKVNRDMSSSLNLAFLDPTGFELHWETVAKLASVRRMDLIIYYPQMGLERYLPLAIEQEGETKIDKFFGGSDWRKIYKNFRGKNGLYWQLMEHYKGKLQEFGYKVFRGDEAIGDDPMIRHRIKNIPLYSLLFAAKHDLAYKLWQGVIRKNVYGQRRMF
jgi:three-Cys-motif partner protein